MGLARGVRAAAQRGNEAARLDPAARAERVEAQLLLIEG
jgi:hypothetical protein